MLDAKTIESAKRTVLVEELNTLGLPWDESMPNKELREILLKNLATNSEVTPPAETLETVSESESTEPESTEPESTEPESTEPESTEPESTEPESTEPQEQSKEVANSAVAGIIAARKRAVSTGLSNQPISTSSAIQQRRAAAGQCRTGASIAEIIAQRRRK